MSNQTRHHSNIHVRIRTQGFHVTMKTTQERTHNENRHCRQKTPHDVCESDIIICIKTSQMSKLGLHFETQFRLTPQRSLPAYSYTRNPILEGLVNPEKPRISSSQKKSSTQKFKFGILQFSKSLEALTILEGTMLILHQTPHVGWLVGSSLSRCAFTSMHNICVQTIYGFFGDKKIRPYSQSATFKLSSKGGLVF